MTSLLSLFRARGGLSLRAMLITAPILAGCESTFVDLDLPDTVEVGQEIPVSVTHQISGDPDLYGSGADRYYFVAEVPENWEVADGATYEGTSDGDPLNPALPVNVVDGPEASSPYIVAFAGGCQASVTLRAGPTLSAPPVATLFSSGGADAFAARDAGGIDLTSFQGDDLFVVISTTNCPEGPMGIFVDNLSFTVDGGSNLVLNPSFESGLDDWSPGVDFDTGCLYGAAAGGTTPGAGEFTIPAPVDGVSLLASDADDPSHCELVQSVTVPGDADTGTFAGSVGSDYLQILAPGAPAEQDALMDVYTPEPAPGNKLVWLQVGPDIRLGGLMDGDGGTLNVTFVATEESEGPASVKFYHGMYVEEPVVIEDPEEQGQPARAFGVRPDISGVRSTRQALDMIGAAIGANPNVSPGYFGVAFWFIDIPDGQEPTFLPTEIEGAIDVLPSDAAPDDGSRGEPVPVPVMGGLMLVITGMGLGLIGLRRRKRK